jgi:hypothetical protein
MDDNVSYPKGDLRRMLAVLASIETLGERATLVNLARATGLDKKTVGELALKAIDQAGVAVFKDGPRYWIEDWGPVFKRQGAHQVLQGRVGRRPAPVR